MTTEEQFLIKINQIEENSLNQNLSFLNFNPWPYVRLNLMYQYLPKNHDKSILKESLLTRVNNLIKSSKNYRGNPIQSANKEIIYFSNLSWFGIKLNKKIFNKYSDSFHQLLNDTNRIQQIELSNFGFNDKFSQNVIYINWLIQIERIKHNIKSLLIKEKEEFCPKLNSEIKKQFGFEFTSTKALRDIKIISEVLIKILNQFKPKLLILECFYHPVGMAICLAGAKLQIPVIEIQHGGIRINHCMYSNWAGIPRLGHQLLPDVFWTWDKESQSVLQKWMENTNYHRTLVGGNTWKTYNQNFLVNKNNKTKNNILFDSHKKHILVSLQGASEFPKLMLEMIDLFKDDVFWHFREHPTLRIDEYPKRQIELQRNAKFHSRDDYTLDEVLNRVQLHVTSSSSVAIEAREYGVPTIFLSKSGLEGYRNYVDNKIMFYAKDIKNVEKLINRVLSKWKKNTIKNEYNTIEHHKKILKRIINET